jgi:hypothetical protein
MAPNVNLHARLLNDDAACRLPLGPKLSGCDELVDALTRDAEQPCHLNR